MVDMISKGIVEGLKSSIIKFLSWLGTSILGGSYWICLILCLAALILYIAGYKKSGKYVGISLLLFFILQCIKVVV
jgi:hypothetical protein